VVKAPTLILLLIGAACRGSTRSSDALPPRQTHMASIAAGDSDTAYVRELRPGYYIAPWNEGKVTHWLLVLVTPRFQGVTYYAAEASPLCSLEMHGDSVGFLTDALPYWSSGTHFRFAFLGKLESGALKGSLLMDGGPHSYNGRQFPTEFEFFPTDTLSTTADTSRAGDFASVRYVGEEGDLLGDEVLLVNTNRGLAAFYTGYWGVPDGPFPAESISFHGDTLTLAVRLPRGDQSASGLTFVLRPPNLTLEPDTSGNDDSTNPKTLVKKASVAELFEQVASRGCAHPSSSKVGG